MSGSAPPAVPSADSAASMTAWIWSQEAWSSVGSVAGGTATQSESNRSCAPWAASVTSSLIEPRAVTSAANASRASSTRPSSFPTTSSTALSPSRSARTPW